jgi:hypothetical protein
MKEKNKFKIGDIVIGNDLANGRYNHTTKGWKGIVTAIYPNDEIKVDHYTVDPECFDLLEATPEPEVEAGINYEIY